MATTSLLKTANEIISEVVSYIAGVNVAASRMTDYDLRKITGIDPHAVQMSKVWTLVDYIQKAQSVTGFSEVLGNRAYRLQLVAALDINPSTGRPYTENEVNEMIIADLEDFGKSPPRYQYRGRSTKSTGTVYALNQSGAYIGIPAGTIVSTNTGVQFEVVGSYGASPIYLTNLSGYGFEVQIRAMVAGLTGNVPAYSIANIEGVSDISRVVNLNPTTGGGSKEDLRTYMGRIQAIEQGRNFPTKGGYYSYLMAKDDVYDVYVRMPYDNLMFREGTDLWVYAETQQPVTETKTYYTSEDIILSKQPVVSITSVVGSVTYVEGTDFDLVTDAGGYGRSYKARDRIRFKAGQEPSNGESLTIMFIYNSAIEELQEDLFDEENRELNNSVLVKWGFKVYADMQIAFTTLPGYTAAEVEADVTTAVGFYFSGNAAGTILRKTLGYHTGETGILYRNNNVQQSDVIAIIESVEGVDRVTVPLTEFAISPDVRTVNFATGIATIETRQSDTTSESVITINDLEYAALGSIAYL